VVHRRDHLRASKIMQERALANPKIRFEWDAAIEEILGDAKGVTGARLKNLKTGATKDVNAKGVFVAIGHQPTTDLFKDVLKLQANGYLWVQPGTTRTSLEGVFAAGDVSDATYRQAISAAGTGCMAAIDAERFMTEHGE
jgi:thioredoxin reductase (NADPH)